MPTASNSPVSELTLRLEQRKSVTFRLSFVDTQRNGIDIIGAAVRFVMRPYGDTQTGDNTASVDIDGVVDEPELGYARFDIQASELDLDAGLYSYAIVLQAESGYSAVVVKGDVELLANTEWASIDTDNTETSYPAFNIQIMLGRADPLTEVTGVPGPNQVLFTSGLKATIEQLDNRMDALESGGVVLRVDGRAPDGTGNVQLDIPTYNNPMVILETGEALPIPTVPGTVIGRIAPLVTSLEVVDASAEGISASDDELGVPVPADAATGDYLVAVLTSQNTGQTWTAPLGWEPLGEITTGDARSLYAYGFPVEGSPPVGPIVFSASAAGRQVGVMFRVLGVDLSNALQAAAIVSTGRTSNFVTVPQLNGAAGGLVISIVCGNNSSGLPYPIPADWSNGMSPFIAEASSPDNSASLTWLSVAAATTVIDFNEHVITAAGAVTQLAGVAFALRSA